MRRCCHRMTSRRARRRLSRDSHPLVHSACPIVSAPGDRTLCTRSAQPCSKRYAAASISSSLSSTSFAASPSGMKLSLLVARPIRVVMPHSTRWVMTPSLHPPLARVSSATKTARVACVSRMRSSDGSGASQRRSTTRTPMPRRVSRSATRRLILTPFPQVTIVRSRPWP